MTKKKKRDLNPHINRFIITYAKGTKKRLESAHKQIHTYLCITLHSKGKDPTSTLVPTYKEIWIACWHYSYIIIIIYTRDRHNGRYYKTKLVLCNYKSSWQKLSFTASVPPAPAGKKMSAVSALQVLLPTQLGQSIASFL